MMIRIAAAALLGSAVCLLLRQSNAAVALPLSAAVCAFVFRIAATLLEPVLTAMGEARKLSGLSEAYVFPVLKCVAIGMISRAAADICRDAGQGAMAGAVEFGGAAAALSISLPLLQTLLGLLETLL